MSSTGEVKKTPEATETPKDDTAKAPVNLLDPKKVRNGNIILN
jgi:hypothetical protein